MPRGLGRDARQVSQLEVLTCLNDSPIPDQASTHHRERPYRLNRRWELTNGDGPETSQTIGDHGSVDSGERDQLNASCDCGVRLGLERNTTRNSISVALQFRSNRPLVSAFRYLTLTGARAIPRRLMAVPSIGGYVTLLGSTPHRSRTGDGKRCEEARATAGPASWWPDRHLSTPVSASATAATALPAAYRAPLRVGAARRIPPPGSD